MQHACFCEFSTVLSELRQKLAAERAKVLDLPPLPQRRVNLTFEVRFSAANQKHLLSFRDTSRF